MENLDLPSPQIKDGKMARFGFCAASSLIWGDGGLLFHFILSKIVVRPTFKVMVRYFAYLYSNEFQAQQQAHSDE